MNKKFLIIIILLLSFSSISFCQKAKKPTLIILPSDNWCTMRYFTTTYNNQGTDVKVANYSQAFQEDTELGSVIAKVGGLLTGLGYSVKDAEQEIRTMNQRQAEDNVSMSKNTGAGIAETPLDQIKKRVKADILIQIWWKVNKEGNAKSVTFTLEAFDTYTSKRIATSNGTGPASLEIVPVLLEEAVKNNIAEFDNQMSLFYNDITTNGREIVINIKKWDDWDKDLESEINWQTILDIIDDWMHDNTVNDSYNLSDATDNYASFEQVRIPIFNDKGRAVDARAFVSGLQKHLRSLGIPSKLSLRGLGEANLILGEQ